MKLYMMRHGEAINDALSPGKPLSAKGRDEVRKISALLKSKNVEISGILHSGKLRAIQTSKIIADNQSVNVRCEQKDYLDPYGSVDSAVSEISGLRDERSDFSLMIVGHLPFLRELTRALTRSNSITESINFCTGSLICLEKGPGNTWKYSWSASPSEVFAE
jgi:phosphohistidine phosphatase